MIQKMLLLGTSEASLRLSALLTRAERLTNRRNRLTHGLWAHELDGDPGLMGAPGELEALPSLAQLRTLASQLVELTRELNAARIEGFLKEALEQTEVTR